MFGQLILRPVQARPEGSDVDWLFHASNVHNAHHHVKAKRTSVGVHKAQMSDDRPDEAIRLQAARERRGFKSAKDAATFFGWKYDSYIQHERGERGIKKVAEKYAKAFRVSAAWLLTGETNHLSPEDQEALDLLRQARALGKFAAAASYLRYLVSESAKIEEPTTAPPAQDPEIHEELK